MARSTRVGAYVWRSGTRLKDALVGFARWLNSPAGHGVLKCSLAYTIASLATFAPPLSDFLGRPGGKHVVATMTVYFHPARTAGSMIEAIMIAIVAVLYAELVSLLSMVTSVLVGSVWGLVTLAHVLVVVVCIGGGFGFIGWVKQKMGNPLVNVASTLASLAIISVVTKESAVVKNVFSNQKIIQVLKMLVMGITSTAVVNLVIWRVSARALLRGSMTKVSTSLADMLSLITRGFLNGSENDLALAEYLASSSTYSSLYPQLLKNLREAKFEHYFVGHHELYAAQRSIVQAMEALAQSIGGLRSATVPLIRLIEASENSDGARSPSPQLDGPESRLSYVSAVTSPLALEENQDGIDGILDAQQSRRTSHGCTPPEFFKIFLDTISEPMEALSSGLCKALWESQFHKESPEGGPDTAHFTHALSASLGSFNIARAKGLQEMYEHSTLRDSKSPSLQAELEQVAAACGHFTYSLQSVAEEVQKYLDLIDNMKYTEEHGKRGWSWLWRGFKRSKNPKRIDALEEEGLIKPIRKSGVPKGIPDSLVKQRDTFSWKTAPGASRIVAMVSQKILRVVRKMARDDSEYLEYDFLLQSHTDMS